MHSSGWEGVRAGTRGCVGDGGHLAVPRPLRAGMGEHFSSCLSLLPRAPPHSQAASLCSTWVSRGMFWHNCRCGEGSLTSANTFGQRAGAKGAPRVAELNQHQTRLHLHCGPGPRLCLDMGFFWCFLTWCFPLSSRGFSPAVPGRAGGRPSPWGRPQLSGPVPAPPPAARRLRARCHPAARPACPQAFLALPAPPRRGAVPAEPALGG